MTLEDQLKSLQENKSKIKELFSDLLADFQGGNVIGFLKNTAQQTSLILTMLMMKFTVYAMNGPNLTWFDVMGKKNCRALSGHNANAKCRVPIKCSFIRCDENDNIEMKETSTKYGNNKEKYYGFMLDKKILSKDRTMKLLGGNNELKPDNRYDNSYNGLEQFDKFNPYDIIEKFDKTIKRNKDNYNSFVSRIYFEIDKNGNNVISKVSTRIMNNVSLQGIYKLLYAYKIMEVIYNNFEYKSINRKQLEHKSSATLIDFSGMGITFSDFKKNIRKLMKHLSFYDKNSFAAIAVEKLISAIDMFMDITANNHQLNELSSYLINQFHGLVTHKRLKSDQFISACILNFECVDGSFDPRFLTRFNDEEIEYYNMIMLLPVFKRKEINDYDQVIVDCLFPLYEQLKSLHFDEILTSAFIYKMYVRPLHSKKNTGKENKIKQIKQNMRDISKTYYSKKQGIELKNLTKSDFELSNTNTSSNSNNNNRGMSLLDKMIKQNQGIENYNKFLETYREQYDKILQADSPQKEGL